MKKLLLISLVVFFSLVSFGGTIVKIYHFDKVKIKSIGNYQTISFPNTILSGNAGEPMVPWSAVSLILPPGESAREIRMESSGFVEIPGSFNILPQQNIRPVSKGTDGTFLKNENVYSSGSSYPVVNKGRLSTSYLNGYAFGLCTFTPLVYYPALQKAGYYSEVTITITTEPSGASTKALKNLSSSPAVLKRVKDFANNPEMMLTYPELKRNNSGYSILIITSQAFQAGFSDLTHMYDSLGLGSQIHTVAQIETSMTGRDTQEKIRNFIIQEYQQNGIEYVLLGGDVEVVPYRGFYCSVLSGGQTYEDYSIPADLYFSGLDGDYDANGNSIFGEVADDPDLLPDVSVGRLPFSTNQEQANMIHKTVWYRSHPFNGELAKPLLAAEFMDANPLTFGQDYIELIVDDHNDNNYYTHGIPSASNTITRLYDTLIDPNGPVVYQWGKDDLLSRINEGHSFIHHCGHANETYVMRFDISDITNSNFHSIDGVTHNYTLLYTHGCDCGAFDYSDCIAERMLSIQNFLAAGIFNSRYGWFDEGTTEGPSCHLHREFVSAMYNDTLADQVREIGTAHLTSKVKTAPWVGLPNEFEPGAQRWCHYDCNLLGDPALKVWTADEQVGIPSIKSFSNLSVYPNPCRDQVTLDFGKILSERIDISIFNTLEQEVGAWRYNDPNIDSKLILSVQGLKPGIYMIKADGSTYHQSAKLIVR
jgi:hypothetical protein